MNRAKWEAEIADLMTLAQAQRREAIAMGDPLRAMRAQSALVAAEGLLADQLSYCNAMLDVGQALVKVEEHWPR